MNQKDLIKRINKQTRKMKESNEKKLGVKISEKELTIDHVMADVNDQKVDNYIFSHGEMEFHNAR